MASVTYDDRCFLVDGKPIWLVSGSVHYFRVPAGQWRDCLLKAKRGGLNCISTYIAWNFHEPREGQWELSGDHDVVSFVKLAGELGLYVILRPGPYICAEWDFGGLPGWLTTKSGIAYRTANATYMHYFDKYFRQVLPRLAELQVTRGGNVILVQNENEYMMTAMPDRLNYLQFITQLLRRGGFEIPIITCNLCTDPPLPGVIDCVNGWGNLTRLLKRLRLRQPDSPLLVTEFWDGWMDHWGGEHQRRDARASARQAMEILGCGAQFNYYMYHGGTNFAFWGSKLAVSQESYQTTSYDYDAPLAEGGGLTEKYYALRPVNLLAQHMGRYFARCILHDPGVNVHDATDVMNISGPAGGWAIVTNNGRDEISSAAVSLPNGRDLTVPLSSIGAAAIPVELRLNDQHVLDYSTLTPMGFLADQFLLLQGPPDWRGQVSIDSKPLAVQVGQADEPRIVDHQGLKIVVVNSDLAARTWVLEDEVIFGPRFVGELAAQVTAAPGKPQYTVLTLGDGKLTRRKIQGSNGRPPSAPGLGSWKRISVCVEPHSDQGWRSLSKPASLDALGVHYGYAWYRLELNLPRPGRRHLWLGECEDRAVLFLNGELLGTWGRGPGAGRDPIPAGFRSGRNVLTMLVDNLGRSNIAHAFGDPKGLFGHIYDAKPLKLPKPRIKPLGEWPRRIFPRNLEHVIPSLEQTPGYEVEVSLVMTKAAPVHFTFADLPYSVALLCNERVAGIFPAYWTDRNHGDAMLGPLLRKGRNNLKLLLWGQQTPKGLAGFRFFGLGECLSERGKLLWKPWEMPTAGGPTVAKDHPAWYAATFQVAERNQPLFLHATGAHKGQLFLNGHNVGRYWNIGPQQYYYLPEDWLQQVNQVLLFEETGTVPREARLEYRPLGPYRP
jgi:hypothetical protein